MFAFERHHSEVVILKLYPASKLTWRARQASNTEFLTQQDESKAQENAFLKFPGYTDAPSFQVTLQEAHLWRRDHINIRIREEKKNSRKTLFWRKLGMG